MLIYHFYLFIFAFIPNISTFRLKQTIRDISNDELRAIFAEIDPQSSGYISINSLYSSISDRYGKSASSKQPSNVIEVVKAKIRQRAGHGGMKALSRFGFPVCVCVCVCINLFLHFHSLCSYLCVEF